VWIKNHARKGRGYQQEKLRKGKKHPKPDLLGKNIHEGTEGSSEEANRAKGDQKK